jgi:hypothetical protein
MAESSASTQKAPYRASPEKPPMLLVLILPFLASADDTSIPAPAVNITQLNHTLLIDYTNTILYSLSPVWSLTFGPTVVDEVTTEIHYSVSTYVVEYVPTLYWIKRVFVVTPAPSNYVLPPHPTKALSSSFFHPGILCGVTFAIVFLGGGFWTYRCKKPRHVIAPPPRKVSDSDSMDSLGHKKGSSGGSKHGSSHGSAHGSAKKKSGRRGKV